VTVKRKNLNSFFTQIIITGPDYQLIKTYFPAQYYVMASKRF